MCPLSLWISREPGPGFPWGKLEATTSRLRCLGVGPESNCGENNDFWIDLPFCKRNVKNYRHMYWFYVYVFHNIHNIIYIYACIYYHICQINNYWDIFARFQNHPAPVLPPKQLVAGWCHALQLLFAKNCTNLWQLPTANSPERCAVKVATLRAFGLETEGWVNMIFLP